MGQIVFYHIDCVKFIFPDKFYLGVIAKQLGHRNKRMPTRYAYLADTHSAIKLLEAGEEMLKVLRSVWRALVDDFRTLSFNQLEVVTPILLQGLAV